MKDQQNLLLPTPGEQLASKRESLGYSLDEAVDKSGMSRQVLGALESGRTSHIPGVYLKGHYRNYARFLGIEEDSFESEIENIRCGVSDLQPVFEEKGRAGNRERWLKVSGYLAASVMIAALAWQLTHEAVRFSQGEVPARTASSAEGSGGENTDGESAETTRPTHLNASIAAVGSLREPVAEPAGTDVAVEAWNAIRNPAAAASEHLLMVETSADSWIEIYGQDGNRLEMDLVRAGSSREYRGEGPFDVTIGRASAVILTLDGEIIDLEPHTHDEVASLLLAAGEAFEGSEDNENGDH